MAKSFRRVRDFLWQDDTSNCKILLGQRFFFFLFVVLLVVLKCHSLIRTFFLHIFYWTKLSFCLLNEIQLMDFLRGFIQRTYKREHNLPKIYRPRALQHRLTTRGCVIDFRLSYNVWGFFDISGSGAY